MGPYTPETTLDALVAFTRDHFVGVAIFGVEMTVIDLDSDAAALRSYPLLRWDPVDLYLDRMANTDRGNVDDRLNVYEFTIEYAPASAFTPDRGVTVPAIERRMLTDGYGLLWALTKESNRAGGTTLGDAVRDIGYRGRLRFPRDPYAKDLDALTLACKGQIAVREHNQGR